MTNKSEYRPVLPLSDEVARKIAAGEVIDRPAAVVRELLDNAIDCGATRISVEIAEGGIERIRVSDNGWGMTREDLETCVLSHTTSKIREENDLLSLSTLGFRGEALSSIQAVSRLEITTTRDGRNAWKLSDGKITPDRLSQGTIVQADALFENFPARKQFLKRASTEGSLCKNLFLEKALAWPMIEFRYIVDGTARLILTPASSLRERALDGLQPKEGAPFFYELSGSGHGFSFSLVIGSPEVTRHDRRDIQIFVNGRKINEYSLIQAIEYGSEGYFPNGSHPFALLFVTIDSSLVDFNIHPAKREVRFKDSPAIHHEVSQTVRSFFRQGAVKVLAQSATGTENQLNWDLAVASPDRDTHPQTPASLYHQSVSYTDTDTVKPSSPSYGFHYLGQILGTFLVVEHRDFLYLVDQHAAHERILYDGLVQEGGAIQELLVPYKIETSHSAEDLLLQNNLDELTRAGFHLENQGEGLWLATAVPARWTGSEADLAKDLLSPRSGLSALISRIYASIACRAACKDGDVLDRDTALTILTSAFALPEPVCPHGRPIWIQISRSELFHRIQRD